MNILNDKTVLVIGGTGFLGKYISSLLVKKGYDVHILSRGKKFIKIDGVKERIISNRREYSQLASVLANRKYDYIIDLCAYNGVDVQLLMQFVDVKYLKKYILFSTGAVFNCNNMPITDKTSITDDLSNEYVNGKIKAEEYLKTHVVPYLILRPGYVYGPFNSNDREKIVFSAIENQKILYIKDIDMCIQSIYVSDLAEIACMFLENNTLMNITLPIYSDQLFSFKEYVSICEGITGSKCLFSANKTECNGRLPYLPISIYFRSELFNSLVKDLKFVKLADGLEKCYKFYKDEVK